MVFVSYRAIVLMLYVLEIPYGLVPHFSMFWKYHIVFVSYLATFGCYMFWKYHIVFVSYIAKVFVPYVLEIPYGISFLPRHSFGAI